MFLLAALSYLVTFMTVINFLPIVSAYGLGNLLVCSPYDPKQKDDLFPKHLQFKYESQTRSRAIIKLGCSPCTAEVYLLP